MRNDPRTSATANLRAEIARQQRRQADLADVWQMSEMGVSRRLTGRTAITVEQFVSAAQWLGIDPADLLPESVAS